MSETESKFEIQIDEETTIKRDDIVEHAEHGPMMVDQITVSPFNKKVQLQAENSPIGLKLTEERLREEWGETIAGDPFELHDAGPAKFGHTNIGIDELDVDVTVETEGVPKEIAEKVHMHVIDQAVKVQQAFRDEVSSEECDGGPVAIDWEGT